CRDLLRDEEWPRQELPNLARARDGQSLVFRELVDPEDGDDVLQVLVALQNLLHLTGDAVVLVPDDARIENPGRRRQRIDRRIDAELGTGARQGGRSIAVRDSR